MAEESKDKGTLTDEQKIIVKEIAKQAKELGIDPRFAVALANLESDFRHVPAEDKSSTAFGPFQVNKATAETNGVDYKAMQEDPKLAIRAGLLNIVRHANNPDLGGDPMRIAAAHRYGENSEFAKTGDPKGIDPTLRDYLVNVAHHFPDSTLPEVVYTKAEQAPPQAEAGAEQNAEEPQEWKAAPSQAMPLPVQSAITGAAGAALGPVTAITHPLVSLAWEKTFGRKGQEAPGAMPSDQSSQWPREGATPARPAQAQPIVEDEFTRAEKQRLGAGDKTGMTGRESQTGYTEATAQQAARRKVQERIAGKAGLDVERPLAEYPNVASTKTGVLIPQDELNRQRAEVVRQRQLAEARARINQQMALRNAQRVGQDWQQMTAAGSTWKPSLGSQVKGVIGKAVSNMAPTSKTLPGMAGRVGFGVGAALPYSVELYQQGYPKTAAGLPVAMGTLANYFPKTASGLSTLAALMSAGYAAAHPREFAAGLTPHDINPTAFIGMPEESEAAFPEYRGR